MDKIIIEELCIHAIVGILDWERKVPQELVLTVELQTDLSRAAKSQNIDDAIDYALVAARLDDFIVSSKFKLLETLVEQAADMLLTEFVTPWVKIRCVKTQVLKNTKAVGVEVIRTKNV
ncbi:MAG: dihydroneopterin aldolase [Agarilytica sp.]